MQESIPNDREHVFDNITYQYLCAKIKALESCVDTVQLKEIYNILGI